MWTEHERRKVNPKKKKRKSGCLYKLIVYCILLLVSYVGALITFNTNLSPPASFVIYGVFTFVFTWIVYLIVGMRLVKW